jgi:HNH endonuclease
MRYIQRLSKPDKLVESEKKWTDTFLASGEKRPESKQYGHEKIKSLLFTMSHNKCYYCEQQLKGVPSEIDHFIEVAECKDLAYSWENLYLACHNCNGKVPNKSIAVTTVLDPCKDSDEEIMQHLTFEDEEIISKNGSEKGLRTITKYKLSSEDLDAIRGKFLKQFHKKIIELQTIRIKENRKLNVAETKSLLRFAAPDFPFSLMFRIQLKKYNFL